MYEMERRTLVSVIEVRTARAGSADSIGELDGHAAVWDTETIIAGLYRERIARGAFTASVKEDVIVALFNHDWNTPLGKNRSGTLRVSEDSIGLRYVVDVPDTSWGRDLLVSVRRRDVSQSSFGFQILRDEWLKPTSRDALPIRTILEARVFDVSPVVAPAYPTTSVSARSEGVYVR